MTPEERAEKIMAIVRNPDTISPDQIEMGAAEIRAAVDEARGKELMVHCYCAGGTAHWLYICDGCKGSRINLTNPDEIKAEAYEEIRRFLDEKLADHTR